MNLTKDFILEKKIQLHLSIFLKQYGTSGLEEALQIYINMQRQKYIIKNQKSISKININDIYYLEIYKHNITIYTNYGTYKKYGSLNNELKFLSPYNFIKCNQSCIVSLEKSEQFPLIK